LEARIPSLTSVPLSPPVGRSLALFYDGSHPHGSPRTPGLIQEEDEIEEEPPACGSLLPNLCWWSPFSRYFSSARNGILLSLDLQFLEVRFFVDWNVFSFMTALVLMLLLLFNDFREQGLHSLE